ncbi:MAG: FkbM family methyltransferase [Comamonadaceae bacterium]|nr:MAG: FkbM family methyltransferase [Comamonadaceae bacterium]
MTPTLLSEPAGFLAQWRADNTATNALVQRFLAPDTPRYALGRNENSLRLTQDVRLDGILDDFAAQPMQWQGLPVVRQDDLPPQAVVVNTVAVARPVSAANRLRKLGADRWINQSDLLRVQPERFTAPEFVALSHEALASEGPAFEALYHALADDASRATLLDVFRYRLTGDPAFMHSYSCRMKDQYFESFYRFPEGGVFIDAGGYDGETSIEFARRQPGYGSIQVFEPSATNHAKVVQALQGMRSVQVHAVGLSNQQDTLRFSGEAGSASKITGEGSESIAVDRLDRLVPSQVDFIKMDLEGWELNALEGARESILRDHPILAISAYHHPLDFVRIPAYVLGLRKDYSLYLRHYTEGWTESVLYFVPRHQG